MPFGDVRDAGLFAHHLRRADVAKRQIRSNGATRGSHRRGTTAVGAGTGGRSSTIGTRGRCHLITGLIVTVPETAPAGSHPPSNWPKSSLETAADQGQSGLSIGCKANEGGGSRRRARGRDELTRSRKVLPVTAGIKMGTAGSSQAKVRPRSFWSRCHTGACEFSAQRLAREREACVV